MKTVGIICEYNPLHNGHQKQMRLVRQKFGQDTAIVCMMSGNYVQRGEPAVMDKMTRAKAAVLCGADLVLELPVTKALSSAEGFAAGGVAALDALGCVDDLCFGCECGDDNRIMSTAKILLTEEYRQVLREKLQGGNSFAAARQAALEQLTGNAMPVTTPNDILAVEYCKALLASGAAMRPLPLLRAGDYHAKTPDAENPSATSLRKLRVQDWSEYVPEAARTVYCGAPTFALRYGGRAVLARLRTMTDDAFAALPFGNEGLWRKFARACRSGGSVEEIIALTKSKRYARSRIARMVLCAYLGISEETMCKPIPYLRVLAMNRRGVEILHRCKKTSSLPLVNAGATPPDLEYFRLECRCADLFALFSASDSPCECQNEKKARIFYQKT